MGLVIAPNELNPMKQKLYIWGFPKIGVSQNGWFIMENPIKMDDLGYPYFWKYPYNDLESMSRFCNNILFSTEGP